MDSDSFSAKEILVEFRKEVREEFRLLRESIATKEQDKETRIRALERFRYAIPSTAIIAVAISGAAFIMGIVRG